MRVQDFSMSLPMMLYRALDVVMPRFRAIFREFGLTEQQWRILRVLWEREELSSRELADLTLIPPPSLVGIVDRLEQRDMVARRRDENDRRGVFVSITREGRKLKRLVTPRVDAAYREIRRSVEPDAWAQLVHGLDSICRIDEVTDDLPVAVNK